MLRLCWLVVLASAVSTDLPLASPLAQWAIHVDGNSSLAAQIAEDHGLIFQGPIGSLKDMYRFEMPFEIMPLRIRRDDHHERVLDVTKALQDHPTVLAISHQVGMGS